MLEGCEKAEAERPVDGEAKGATSLGGRTPAEIADSGLRIDQLATPMMTLSRSAVAHNVATMASWCRDENLLIAPHGKTTMAPALWNRQLDAGAWGITIANEPQLSVVLSRRVPRVMLANPLVRPEGVMAVRAALESGRLAEAIVWADSVEAVERIAAVDDAAPRIGVLVEIGAAGGRTGVRTPREARLVAERVSAAPGLELLGVAGYEGAVADFRKEPARFLAYLDSVAAGFREVGPLVERDDAIVSIGGSAGIARTVRFLRERIPADQATVIIRSGVYIAHDDGYYLDQAEPELPLQAAVSVWARVLSTPEPGLALLDAGRRDVSYDQGLPVVLGAHRAGSELELVAPTVSDLNDQHAFVRYGTRGPALAVGDLVELGVSHPCTTFDRWPIILEVDKRGDSAATVIGIVRTHF
jgi:D-serine deaminase-like pyridoxal phosphate-dependent protein